VRPNNRMKLTRGEGGSPGPGAHSRASRARGVFESPRAAYPGVGRTIETAPLPGNANRERSSTTAQP
jgi:hypothetical protein